MDLKEGTRLGPYVILAPLGAGGMGEVYRAKDRRLDRTVALKVLPADVASDKERLGRFVQEARAASALNHPNVAQIYEIDEAEGVSFFAMEFVEGESLRARMQRSISLDETLDIALQAASGLAAAHRRGIIHRDLKPENIMLRVDGYVKLVDFGLAKMLPWGQEDIAESAATTPKTQSGQVVGTYHYMSPEQARGLAVIPASDVFSFGIVLYELLTSVHPFKSETAMDTLSAILNKEETPISSLSPSVPREVCEIVDRALRKKATDRFPSAVELETELKRVRTTVSALVQESLPALRPKPRWVMAIGFTFIVVLLSLVGWYLWSSSRTTGFSAGVGSVAVMNFRTTPGDTRASTLADGLPEDLSGALSRAGLRVASRGSVLGLASTTDARIVGSQLGVDALLEGSVRSYGSLLRVHVELVSSRTRFQIWSDTFTVEADELLGSEQKTAGEIAKRVRSVLVESR